MPRAAISSPIIPIDTDSIVRIHHDNEVQSALERDIRFATTLHEIPSLRGVTIAELVAGKKHSLARLHDGKVLGWGANGYGQLGELVLLSPPRIDRLTPSLANCRPWRRSCFPLDPRPHRNPSHPLLPQSHPS